MFKKLLTKIDWQALAWRCVIVLACLHLRCRVFGRWVWRYVDLAFDLAALGIVYCVRGLLRCVTVPYLALNAWLGRVWRIRRRSGRWTAGIISVGSTFVAAIGFLLYATMPDWTETDQIWNLKGEVSITFKDRNGALLGHRGGAMDTSYAISDYPPHLIKAVLATEDHRFYSHWGIDPVGLAGAMVWNMNHKGQREKGGSTITQQVVKNIWLTPEHTITRKIKEAWLALWMEHHITKDEILRLYLERSYMGAGNYGIAAASQYYFGKPVTDVTVSEAAMLAGLFKSPVNYSPSSNPEGAKQRSAVVLRLMLDQGVIDQTTYDWALAHPPKIVKHDPLPSEWALDQTYAEAMQIIQDRGLTKYRNFTVYTTLDSDLQQKAEQLLERNIETQGERYDVTQGAMVSMGVDGSLRVLVGGVDYSDNQFNRATQAKRQPGSSFKPFVYLTALLHGMTPETRVVDSPITLNVFGKPWTPANFGDKYYGEITVREALQHSLNTIAVKLSLQFGRQAIIDTAHAAGVQSELKSVASLPLGSNEVTLLEMTNAYTTFASGGQFQPVWSVSRVEHDGDVLYDHAKTENLNMIFPKRAIEDMVSMMKGVVDNGTAGKAKLDVPVAGKTGTTSDYNDAWFIGYTGNLVTGVWYGNDDNWPMEQMTGGTLPAETWHSFMEEAEHKEQPKTLPGIDWHKPTEDELRAQAAAKAKADAAAKAAAAAAAKKKRQEEEAAKTVPDAQPQNCFLGLCGKNGQ